MVGYRSELRLHKRNARPTSYLQASAMWYARFLLLAPSLIFVGCASAIIGSGKDVSNLRTREDVRKELGPPTLSETNDKLTFDEYQTRRKIAEPERAMRASMISAMTFGLAELAVPGLLVDLWSKKSLRFAYDQAGNVTKVILNGEALSLMRAIPATDDSVPESKPADQP